MQSYQRLNLDAPATYRIKVRGRLGESWSSWFDDLTITFDYDDSGQAFTILSGTVADQVALHGLLARIRDLGLPLLQVQYVGQEQSLEEVIPQ